MAWVDLGPPHKEYTPKALFSIFTLIEKGINYLNTSNFPNGIAGTVINAGTLPGSALKSVDVPLYKLNWREFHIPLILAAEHATTTSTSGVNKGGYFAWHPSNFPGPGEWFLEASIAIANASATATCILKGSQEWGSVSTQNTALTRVRSETLTMPPDGETLWIVLKTSNGSYQAVLANARLVFVPG